MKDLALASVLHALGGILAGIYQSDAVPVGSEWRSGHGTFVLMVDIAAFMAVEEFKGHIVYLYSFSKSYAMSGWRLAYMVMPAELKREALKVHDATMICAPRISQLAGVVALSQPSEHKHEFELILNGRRELICQRLDNIRHVVSSRKPEGAYYIFPKIIAAHKNSKEFAIDLLNNAGVTVTPGSAFGPSGEHHVRMAYCVDEDTINLAFDRIEKYFKA